MPDRITSLRAGLRACVFAGKSYPVHEARLCDLADLQAWVDDRWENPSAGLWDALCAAGDDPTARDKVLFQAYAAIADGPPVYHSDEGTITLFGTRAGLAEFLRVALSRGSPGVDPGPLAEAVESGNVDALAWYDEVCRAFYGSDPLRVIARLLGVPEPKPPGEPLAWSEAVVSLAEKFGWALDYCMSLSVSQFFMAYSGGKPVDHSIRIPPDQIDEFNRRRCMALYGEVPDEHVVIPSM